VLVKALINAGAEVDLPARNGDLPLDLALTSGSRSVLVLLLGAGAVIDKDNDKLYRAAFNGELNDGFSRAGIDWNMQDENGYSLLHWAAVGDRPGVISYLHGKTNFLLKTRQHNDTCLDVAVGFNNFVAVKSILKHVGDRLIKDENTSRFPLLNTAVAVSTEAIIAVLLENGAKVTVNDVSGETALHAAVKAANIEAAKLLLKYGADSHQKNNADVSPYELALRFGNNELKELLETKDNAE
jgi:ankyrin repeat protein